ncbi:CKLF-like MARVEL transmembrane domain-containing protein [Pimephales promelas]|nr:CKLF-like MARVEL transmembrane domain-containing protein [Pimephales promelas]
MEIDSESRIDRSSADRTSKSSNIESLGLSHSKLAYDGNFIRSACGMFMAGEIVFGLLVWTLIGGTEYLHVPALGIPQIPWTILGICFNGSASVLYLTAAVVTGVSSNVAIRGRYYFISWVASTIFASIAMVCYAGNTFVNYKSWRSKCEDT